MKKLFLVLLCFSLFQSAFAQIDEIKSGSKNSGRSGGGGESASSGGGIVFDLFFNVFIGEIIQAQQYKLQQRDERREIVSLDLILQAAAQPSSYYIVNPRIRGNWGVFSSDFRLNYLIEEDLDGVRHIRSNEWQVLQLNIINTKDVVLRVGGGFIQESYAAENYYSEWTTAMQIHPWESRFGGVVEYRSADMRQEVSAFGQMKVFDHGVLHGFVTGGAVYQRYYSTVTTWGMQGGLVIRIY